MYIKKTKDITNEISDMSFEEAIDVIISETSSGAISPRKMFSQALSIVLVKVLHGVDNKDDERKKFLKNVENHVKSDDPIGLRRLWKLYDEMYSEEEWETLRCLYNTVSRRRIISLSPLVFSRFKEVVKKYYNKQKAQTKFLEGLKTLCKESGVEYCDFSVSFK